MAKAEDSFKLTITQDIINVLNTSRGRSFSLDELKAITAGELSAPPVSFCVGSIGYVDDGENVLFVQFTSGVNLHSAEVKNLSDFREQFQDAANHGHAIQFVLNNVTKRIEVLVVVPCKCQCGPKTPLTLGTSAEPPEHGTLRP